jgi:outer membrane protein
MRLLLGAAAVSLLLASPSPAATLTLREAADEALRANPEVVVAQAANDAARARLSEARAAWLPVVGATAASTRGNNPVFVFGSLLEQGRFGPQNFDPAFLNDPPALRNDRLTLNVRYAIFDRLRRYNSAAQARHEVTRANTVADETRQRVLAEVIGRYHGLAVAEARRSVAADAVHAAESAAAATRDKVREGLAVESDRLAAEVQVAAFRQQEIEAEGAAAVAGAALAMTLQRPLNEAIEVTPRLTERVFARIGLPAALANAVKARGGVAAARAARAVSELGLRTARADLLPRLDGFGSWGASGRTFNARDSDHTLGLVASIDVFDGGKFARITAARAAVDRARAMETIARNEVEMEAISAWHRVNAASQQVAVASIAAEQAAEGARIVHDRYENGLTTITEELRAQTALVSARLSLLAARNEYITGYAELLRSTGGLHDVDPFL